MSERCVHCGEPTRPGERFCCRGCEAVYSALHEAGFTDYYRLRDAMPAPVAMGAVELSEAALQACRSVDEQGRPVVELSVDGMHCASCAWVIEEAMRRHPSVVEARASLASEGLRLVLQDEGVESVRAALSTLGRFGYTGRPRVADEEDRTAWRGDLLRLGVAGACAMNLMLYAVSLYGGDLFGIEPEFHGLFRWLSLGVSLPLLWAAWPLMQRAVNSLRNGQVHVDVPVALAIAVLWIASTAATVRGEGHVWFDSLGMLVALLLGGRFLEASVRRRATRRLRRLLGRRVPVARLPDGGTVLASDLEVGQRVALRPGDVAVADLRIEQGSSEVDTSVLDGEPRPRPAGPGDELPAGARVLTGLLQASVLRAAGESTVARTEARVHEALAQRSAIELRADAIARYFVVAVLFAGVASFGAWWLLEPAQALPTAVAVLVVACPCALALATPLAFAAAVHGSAARGLLPRSGSALLRLGDAELVVFDKTGTLTDGRPELSRWSGDDEALRLAGSAAQASAHPVSRAVLAAAQDRGLPLSEPIEVVERAGQGLRATVDGRSVRIGAPGASVWIDGRPAGQGELDERLRSGARSAIDELGKLGVAVAVLSGDTHERVVQLAESLPALELARGGQTPSEKRDFVAAQRRAGRVVAFVGDGLNDAEVLAEADVGLAVGGAVEVSLQAADGLVDAVGLQPLIDGVRRARRLRSTLHSNLALSATYNLLAVLAAATGLVGPLEAAVLMPISSLVVLLRSARLAAAVTPPPPIHRRVLAPDPA